MSRKEKENSETLRNIYFGQTMSRPYWDAGGFDHAAPQRNYFERLKTEL